jgi:Na+-transporting NADH:ubiquinone oxidoreductase subunit NqrB
MKPDRIMQAAGPGSFGPMKHWRYIALHAVVAAAFIFLLQHYAMNASFEISLVWALAFGACAAGLAYRQSTR